MIQPYSDAGLCNTDSQGPICTCRYVQEDILRPGDQHYRQFYRIFEAFKLVEPVKKPEVEESPMEVAAKSIEALKKAARLRQQQVEEESDEEEEAEVRREGRKGTKGKLAGGGDGLRWIRMV